MELREFVKSSLLDVLNGIHDAQKEMLPLQGSNGVINPRFNSTRELMEKLQFDVAVTAAATDKVTGKGGINVYAAQIGGDYAREQQSSTVSRLTFSVPFVATTVDVRD